MYFEVNNFKISFHVCQTLLIKLKNVKLQNLLKVFLYICLLQGSDFQYHWMICLSWDAQLEYTVLSAISYFKFCARMNQSLIPPIVKATLKPRYCVKWSTHTWQIAYCVYSIAQLGPNWAKQSAWLQCLIVNSAIFLTDSWFFNMGPLMGQYAVSIRLSQP